MSVFAAAIDDLFGDPHLSRGAVYTPPGGSPVSVTVIASRGAVTDSGLTRAGFRLNAPAQVVALVVDVRRVEIAEPVAGATLMIEGRVHPVRSIGELDPERLVWPLTLGKPIED